MLFLIIILAILIIYSVLITIKFLKFKEFYHKYYKLNLVIKMIYGSEVNILNFIEDLIYIICNNYSNNRFLVYRRKNEHRLSVSELLGVECDICNNNHLVVRKINRFNSELELGDTITSINGESPLKIVKVFEESITIEVNRYINGELVNRNIKFKMPHIVKTINNKFKIHLGVGILKMHMIDSDFVEYALEQIKTNDILELLIDLRGNTGGSITQLIKTCNLLLKKETIIFKKIRDNKCESVITEFGSKYHFDKIIVLVDCVTASSAEILSTTLKENLDAIIVGEKTFGKGIVQEYFQFSDGSSLLLPSYNVLTCNDKDFNNIGVEPDIIINEWDSLENITEQLFINCK